MGISVEELEKLGWYDLLSVAFDFPFCITGGMESSLSLAKLCGVEENSKVLFVGSGTGFTACYWAKEFGCKVYGVDIAEKMVEKSQENAREMGVEHITQFNVGSAYSLPFEDETFDVVISEFVAHLLDLDPLLKDAFRVLKKGGKIGFNEMFKKEEVPPDKRETLIRAEELVSQAVGYVFKLKSPSTWNQVIHDHGFEIIEQEEHVEDISKMKALKDFGGFRKIMGILGDMIRLMRVSDEIKEVFKTMSKGKNLLIRKKNLGEYTGYILICAEKVS